MLDRLNNEALLIIGMQRSGTSATSGALLRLGLDLGSKFMVPDDFNPTGYYELDIIPALDREIHNTMGRNWSDPRSLPLGWEKDPRILAFRDQIRTFLLQNFRGKPFWGIKYPSLCRLLPLWIPLLTDLGVRIKVLIVARKPTEVAFSLVARNKMPYEQSLAAWLNHMIPAVLETENLPRSILLYEDLLSHGSAEIERIVKELNLPLPPIDIEKSESIGKFLTRDLRHHDQPEIDEVKGPWLGWAEKAYDAVLDWRKTGRDPKHILTELSKSIADTEVLATPYSQYIDYLNQKVESIREDYLASFSMRITKPLRILKHGLLMLRKSQRSL